METASSGLNGTTILVAEDDPGTRKFICATLRADGYTVLEASDGIDAMHLLDKHPVPIGVLVSDYVMPGMDGRMLAALVRERHPKVKILLISGEIDLVAVQEGVMDGARHLGAFFLRKPFSQDELWRRVRAVLLND